ncbi:hypothetical protein CALCODRAFT_480664, partial [Calocera cornea HHB12733]
MTYEQCMKEFELYQHIFGSKDEDVWWIVHVFDESILDTDAGRELYRKLVSNRREIGKDASAKNKWDNCLQILGNESISQEERVVSVRAEMAPSDEAARAVLDPSFAVPVRDVFHLTGWEDVPMNFVTVAHAGHLRDYWAVNFILLVQMFGHQALEAAIGFGAMMHPQVWLTLGRARKIWYDKMAEARARGRNASWRDYGSVLVEELTKLFDAKDGLSLKIAEDGVATKKKIVHHVKDDKLPASHYQHGEKFITYVERKMREFMWFIPGTPTTYTEQIKAEDRPGGFGPVFEIIGHYLSPSYASYGPLSNAQGTLFEDSAFRLLALSIVEKTALAKRSAWPNDKLWDTYMDILSSFSPNFNVKELSLCLNSVKLIDEMCPKTKLETIDPCKSLLANSEEATVLAKNLYNHLAARKGWGKQYTAIQTAKQLTVWKSWAEDSMHVLTPPMSPSEAVFKQRVLERLNRFIPLAARAETRLGEILKCEDWIDILSYLDKKLTVVPKRLVPRPEAGADGNIPSQKDDPTMEVKEEAELSTSLKIKRPAKKFTADVRRSRKDLAASAEQAIDDLCGLFNKAAGSILKYDIARLVERASRDHFLYELDGRGDEDVMTNELLRVQELKTGMVSPEKKKKGKEVAGKDDVKEKAGNDKGKAPAERPRPRKVTKPGLP